MILIIQLNYFYGEMNKTLFTVLAPNAHRPIADFAVSLNATANLIAHTGLHPNIKIFAGLA